MKKQLLILLLLFYGTGSFASEWHVSVAGPNPGDGAPGHSGTLASPWDLQTALNHPAAVQAGDVIWIHAGVYNGRYISQLQGSPTNHIVVSAWPGDLVELNGNVTSSNIAVLGVVKGYTTYMNFEVTFKGSFIRDEDQGTPVNCSGLNHTAGPDCKFINLVIHNNPGLGIGSWKDTGGTEFYGCLVYNNGILHHGIDGSGQPYNWGQGEGAYVQNNSTSMRVFDNNIIFNNFYKGMEIWSECQNNANCGGGETQYVQYVTVRNNIIFNSGSPAYGDGTLGTPFLNKDDNLIIATHDSTNVNIPNHIYVRDNVFYHTTNFTNGTSYGECPSLTIGYETDSPVENVEVTGNYIFGRNNALRLFSARSLFFYDNMVWGRYVVINNFNDTSGFMSSFWDFDYNDYNTYKNEQPAHPYGASFRFYGGAPGDITLAQWQTLYGLDASSTWTESGSSAFNPVVTKVIRNQYNPNRFTVTLVNKAMADMSVNFSTYNIPNGTSYVIRDAENYHDSTPVTGTYNTATPNIVFNMQDTDLEFPTSNTLALKSQKNFGVFIIEFDICEVNRTITTAVNGGNYDFKQASNSITASNLFNGSAIGVYHAGSYVDLVPGFDARANSDFTAYIQGCDDIYLYRPAAEEPRGMKDEESISSPVAGSISVYPNPTNGKITLASTQDRIVTITMTSLDGKRVGQIADVNQTEYDLDISGLQQGIYFFTILDSGGKMTVRKIIKN